MWTTLPQPWPGLRGLIGPRSLEFALSLWLPLVLYTLTLAPTIYNLDSAELTTAAASGGLIRATGYPLYLVVGGLWSRLPIGDVGYRMNLLSAICGALTIALSNLLLRRLGLGLWARMSALGLLATAPFFWALALIAEVYTLHTALMAALLLLLLRWRDQPSAGRLAALGLLGGLSMGHHLATALLAPGCLLFVLSVAPRRALAPRALLSAGGAAALGLGIYLLLPLRAAAAPAFNYLGSYDAWGAFHPLNLASPQTLLWLLLGGPFSAQMSGYSGAELAGELRGFGAQLYRSFFAVGLAPGLLGLGLLLRRDRPLGLALSLMFVANVLFFASYRVIDKDTMYLPAYLIWMIWLAIGYQQLLGWLGPGASQLILRGLLGAAVALALVWNYPLVDRSNDWSARERGEAILAVAEPNALVLGWWETVPLIEYLQLVEGARPDVQPINRFLISPDDLLALIEREAARRPVYIDTPTPELTERAWLRSEGPIYRIFPREERP